MTKIGIGLPAQSVGDVMEAAEAVGEYTYDSFSVYGDLGDMPPYAALHAVAEVLKGTAVSYIGPMGFPVGMAHAELITQHARTLETQLPGQTSLGLVRGAFLDQIGERPATVDQLEATVLGVRARLEALGVEIPLYVGGFGPKLLTAAGKISVKGVKLGGTTSVKLAAAAKEQIANPEVEIVLGAVSVIDQDRDVARKRARMEVAKYLAVVGPLDHTLGMEQQMSLQSFMERYNNGEKNAYTSISNGLLDSFAMAGTVDDVAERICAMDGIVDRFELGTPHGLESRSDAIRLVGDTLLKEGLGI